MSGCRLVVKADCVPMVDAKSFIDGLIRAGALESNSGVSVVEPDVMIFCLPRLELLPLACYGFERFLEGLSARPDASPVVVYSVRVECPIESVPADDFGCLVQGFRDHPMVKVANLLNHDEAEDGPPVLELWVDDLEGASAVATELALKACEHNPEKIDQSPWLSAEINREMPGIQAQIPKVDPVDLEDAFTALDRVRVAHAEMQLAHAEHDRLERQTEVDDREETHDAWDDAYAALCCAERELIDAVSELIPLPIYRTLCRGLRGLK